MNLGTAVAGRFRLDAPVGAGGMGTVFRSTDLVDGTQVALKIIEAGSMVAERFEREAVLLSELRDPGIVRYLHHGRLDGGRFYLAMEWIAGQPLSAWLEREGATAAEAVAIVRQVAGAIAVAHAAGVVHRDLKPDNIMLLDGGATVKVIDLGIARRMRDAQTLTRTGTMVGSPGYVAPEQARGSSNLDERVDVFALGCVLYEALTGQAAYAGQSLMARLAKVLLGEPPRVEDRCPEAPPPLRALVASMLAFEPSGRPRDCAEVAAALAALPPIPAGPRRRRETTDDQPTREVLAPGERPPTTRDERVVCLLLVGTNEEDEVASMATMTDAAAASSVDSIRALVADHGARVEALADGSMVVVLRGALPELVDAAIACARVVRGQLPDLPIALSMERRHGGDSMAFAIDRGVSTLVAGTMGSLFAGFGDDDVPDGAIRLDVVAASLLSAHASVRHVKDAYYLTP